MFDASARLVPEFVLATSMISAPIGFLLFILGAAAMDRQFRGVKDYAAATAARQPGLDQALARNTTL